MISEIYTTYFANLKNLPDDIIPINISVRPPIGFKGLNYIKLYPSDNILYKFKKSKDEAQFMREYNEQVLGKLNQYNVLKDLDQLTQIYAEHFLNNPIDKSNGIKIALVCYEKPGDFCHRKLVTRWFKNAGIYVKEYSK